MSKLDKTYLVSDVCVKYAAAHSLRPTEVEKELQDYTQKNFKNNGMMGAPVSLHLMGNLMRIIGAKRVLDVGVFTGSSSLAAALAVGEQGEVHGFDINEDYVKCGYPFFEKAGVRDKFHLHIGPANDSLQKLIDEGQSGTFDFAFIDADKVNYWNYYEKCLQLVRKGGIIAVDNTLWGGEVTDDSANSESTLALKDFNKKIHQDLRVRVSFLTMGDGLSLLFIV
ncbi:O-methyltransferase family 3 [Trinorchestia longiramus]|nr:O-methyltransferase family 3 [Trinorchestia longiramus]